MEPHQSAVITVLVERWTLLCHSAEQPIKEEEGDPKIFVHKAFVIQCPMMSIVRIARVHEPSLQAAIPFHPRAGNVHAVVHIAKHQEGPCQGSPNCHKLMETCYLQIVEHPHRDSKQDRTGNEPLQADVAEAGCVSCGIAVFRSRPL